MEAFAVNYCSDNARQEQKRFMNRVLSKPREMSVQTFWMRLNAMNRMIPYLSGVGDKFPKDQLRDILVHAVPQWQRDVMTTSNYKWDDPNMKDTQVIQYLEKLRLIETVRENAKDSRKAAKKPPHKKHDNKNESKLKKPGNNGTKQCHYCHKFGHIKADCHKRKGDKAKKKDEQHSMEVDEEMHSIESLIAALPNETDSKEVRDLFAIYDYTTTDELFLTSAPTTTDLMAVVKVEIRNRTDSEKGSEKPHRVFLKCLIDTGSSRTIIKKKSLDNKLFEKCKFSKETIWRTNGGNFVTNYDAMLAFAMPEFAPSKEINWPVAVDETTHATTYDMIIGCDLQQALGIDILYSTDHIKWDSIVIPMMSREELQSHEAWLVHPIIDNDEEYVADEIFYDDDIFAQEILDANYKKADIETAVDEMAHLSCDEKSKLKTLLFKYEELFDGTLGEWRTSPVDFELKEGEQPFHLKPYPVPIIHLDTLKKEINRLVQIGVLRPVQESEYASPSIIIPKKNKMVRFVSDFRVLNTKLKRKPFPIPRIQDLLTSLGGFRYATAIDLNMGYWNIRLSPKSSRMCTIVLPFGKYEYLRLPMGVANSVDIFQSKMSDLMTGLEFVRTYLDDLLCVTKNDFDDHLPSLDTCFERLQRANLKVNLLRYRYTRVSRLSRNPRRTSPYCFQSGSDSTFTTTKYFKAIALVSRSSKLLP